MEFGIESLHQNNFSRFWRCSTIFFWDIFEIPYSFFFCSAVCTARIFLIVLADLECHCSRPNVLNNENFHFVQSDLLVVKKQKKRYCPIYFQKVCKAAFHIWVVYSPSLGLHHFPLVQEDIERELTKASKSSRGSALSKQIMACSCIID